MSTQMEINLSSPRVFFPSQHKPQLKPLENVSEARITVDDSNKTLSVIVVKAREMQMTFTDMVDVFV